MSALSDQSQIAAQIDATLDEPALPPEHSPGTLWTPSFIGLMTAQALGSMNDNIFRWIVVGIAISQFAEAQDKSQQSMLVAFGSIALTLPYLLLAAPAGFVADRFPKRNVIVWAKFAEIVVMVLGGLAIWSNNIWAIFVVLAMMGGQSAMYSPARLGSIPELMPEELISKANGWFGLTNLMSVIIGTGIGNYLADNLNRKGETYLATCAAVVIGVATVGWSFSLLIRTCPAGNLQAKVSWNFFAVTWHELRILYSQRGLWRVALGIMFFWSIAALANQNIDQLVKEAGGTWQSHNTPFLIALTLGVGIGSILAGYWSGNRVELGILPIGALGLIITGSCLAYFGTAFFDSSVAEMTPFLLNDLFLRLQVEFGATDFFTLTYSGWLCCGLLFLLGASGGMFDLPLESYLQENSPRETRGSILAANNFLTFTGIIGITGVYMALRAPLGAEVTDAAGQIVLDAAGNATREPLFSARTVFLFCGLVTIPVLYYILKLIPQAALRFVVWMLTSALYRIRVRGIENIPATGPALLCSNHVSWLDAVMVVLTCPRPIRMFAWAGNFESKWMRNLADQWSIILVTSNPKSIIRALDTANAALKNGELVCVFPEGEISRTGNTQTFKPGMMRILNGTGAPVVPVYLDQLWGSIFSFDDGKFFWKWPRKWPYPVGVHFGKPQPAVTHISQARNAVMELGAAAVKARMREKKSVALEALIGCKRRKYRAKMADSTGANLTGGKALAGALALRRALRRILKNHEKTVGVLLPPTVPGVLANFALALDRRVMSNLNYTCTAEILNDCLKQAGIESVITSRKFLDKIELNLAARMILLEDVKTQVTSWDRAVAAFQSYCVPTGLLGWMFGLNDTLGDELLTIIFTSGSTGKPKGVELTHGNVASNIEAIDQIIHLRRDDVLIGILPFFHALGSTVTIWTGTVLDLKTAYHFSPLDPKQVGKLCREHRGTILLTTPTFLRGYIRRCERDDLATLNTVVTGAERLPDDVAKAFEEKFGTLPVEGYGTTELSPLAALNIPPSRAVEGFHPNRKIGTVGRTVPGTTAKILNPDTGLEVPCGQEGLLWITGANVMRGYLHQPDLTAQVIVDGWYCTGDMARLDDEGFVQITGRLSRFSKIGGEMVPHGLVEEELLKALGSGDAEQQPLAVSAVADEKKGERLVVLHTQLAKPPAELCQALAKAGLPNLFIPGGDSFYQVERLPVLGTGKLDLAKVKKMAEEMASTRAVRTAG